MADKREGPEVKTTYSCFGCNYEISESYSCQGDSGRDVYCQHPTFETRRLIGDTTWYTPKFCPFLQNK